MLSSLGFAVSFTPTSSAANSLSLRHRAHSCAFFYSHSRFPPALPVRNAAHRAPRMTASSPTFAVPISRGPTPDSGFNWKNQWYGIIWEEDFDASVPFGFSVWDTPLVMIRDGPSGAFSVFDDACPHRRAPLSEGRVYQRDGAAVLECAYHGWTYGCDGACVRIPQTEVPGKSVIIPKSTHLKKRYPTVVVCGIVFVWYGEEDKADVALVPVPEIMRKRYGQKGVVLYQNATRVLPYDFLTFHESRFMEARAAAKVMAKVVSDEKFVCIFVCLVC